MLFCVLRLDLDIHSPKLHGKSSAWKRELAHMSSLALQTDSVNTTFCNLLKRLFLQSQERIKPAHWSIFVIFFLSNAHTSQQKSSLVNLMDFFSFWNFLFLTVCHYCSLTLKRCFISHFNSGTIFRKLEWMLYLLMYLFK